MRAGYQGKLLEGQHVRSSSPVEAASGNTEVAVEWPVDEGHDTMTPLTTGPRPGRNEPCHCGSGRKYKQCCLEKDELEARAARAKAAEEAPEPPAEATDQPAHTPPPPRERTQQPWKRSSMNTHGFQRMNTPRKVGGS
jgi:hypothetical protein